MFSVVAAGATAYEWHLDSTSLPNGGDITGATTDTLTIANAEQADAGDYFVRVFDSDGFLDSNTVTLTVLCKFKSCLCLCSFCMLQLCVVPISLWQTDS